MEKVVLETKNICKSFYDNKVLENVNFSCVAGEIHTLVGENGAGKSTLMKIISGVHKQTSGEFYINGEKMDFDTTLQAQEAGVSIIHQEFNLVPYLTVYENMFLGRLLTQKNGLTDIAQMRKQTKELAEKMEVELDPDMRVKDLTVAQQQMLEIMKAINLETQIIIMDEPTAALTLVEVEALFKMTRKLKAEGKTIIYISHRLNEVFEISDRVTVLKDGATMGTTRVEDTTKEEVVNMMVGRQMGNIFPERDGMTFTQPVLAVDGLRIKEGQDGFTFTLKEGEILGITGLEGQGQRELVRVLFGLHRALDGTVSIDGKPVKINSTKAAMKQGISFLTDDRKIEGLCLGLPIYSNISLPIIRKLKRRGMILSSYEQAETQQYMKNINIKATSCAQTVKTLSGGNQQKVLLAKCLANKPRILIVHEPTRGIDVAAKVEIYNLLRKLSREEKISIIMVSSDLMEVINVSDRILVVYDGRINGEMDGREATEEGIMRIATNIQAGVGA
ncbi:ribose import ATP-binding protein RbsA [Christensenellaceae bacterium]|nr:ribose import ATP-binding protein RbsA [Christensenellaceae bacterium]BDF61287.1 ribose import ATP-binding protein RbsA [Christensenellaceae bacterium]